jgi:hypothetical protein
MCNARDIASSKQVDFDPKVKCDALSATTSFRARPATVGEKLSGLTSIDNPCLVKDGGAPPSLYECP